MKKYEIKWAKFIGRSYVHAESEEEAKNKAMEGEDGAFVEAGQEEETFILEIKEKGK